MHINTGYLSLYTLTHSSWKILCLCQCICLCICHQQTDGRVDGWRCSKLTWKSTISSSPLSHLPSSCRPCQRGVFYRDPLSSRIHSGLAPLGPHSSTWDKGQVHNLTLILNLEFRIWMLSLVLIHILTWHVPPQWRPLAQWFPRCRAELSPAGCIIISIWDIELHNALLSKVWWRITWRIPMRLFIGSVLSWHIYGPAPQDLFNLNAQFDLVTFQHMTLEPNNVLISPSRAILSPQIKEKSN